jgi:hypothetical protein
LKEIARSAATFLGENQGVPAWAGALSLHIDGEQQIVLRPSETNIRKIIPPCLPAFSQQFAQYLLMQRLRHVYLIRKSASAEPWQKSILQSSLINFAPFDQLFLSAFKESAAVSLPVKFPTVFCGKYPLCRQSFPVPGIKLIYYLVIKYNINTLSRFFPGRSSLQTYNSFQKTALSNYG